MLVKSAHEERGEDDQGYRDLSNSDGCVALLEAPDIIVLFTLASDVYRFSYFFNVFFFWQYKISST